MNVEFRASYGILLRFLNPDGSLDRLLSPIGTSISNSIYTIDQTIDQNDPDDDEDRTIERSMIIDEECDSIEDQLGLAFVASQTHITRVASMCRRIHDCCEHKTGSKRLLNIDGNKWEILGLTNADIVPVGGTRYPAVRGLYEFANYFKHRDEWRRDWTPLNDNQKRTIEVIQAFGAQPGSTGNLRHGFAGLFGNDDFANVGQIADAVEAWTRAIRKAYERELGL